MRMRRRKSKAEDAEVMLSPLIDCVFLLLIFFLVTSIIKRYERQIPVTLADPTAAVASIAQGDAYLLGLDVDGVMHRQAGRDDIGIMRFEPIPDPAAFLAELVATRGPDAPIELVVEQDTPFQTVIDNLDRLQAASLTSVRPRMRDGGL